MSNCIHTGCIVFIQSYGILVNADLYSIQGHYIVRWIPKEEDNTNYVVNPIEMDYTVSPCGARYDWVRLDIGVLVVPTTHLIAHNERALKRLMNVDNVLNRPAFIPHPSPSIEG